jgi:cytochrome c
MKVSHLSSLWDYIHRAMPWNAPKSLSTDEVYGVLAYILSLGEIVPADFTLSDKNIAEVEKRLPNRYGHFFMKEMWEVRGKGDVVNPLCMSNCPVEGSIESSLPEGARNSNGNIAEQVRGFGEARGTDTALPPRKAKVGMPDAAVSVQVAAASTSPAVATAAPATAPRPDAAKALALIQSNGCVGCHGIANKIVGPGFQEVAKKYSGRADEVGYLSVKIRKGGQGVWGPIPMPEQAQLSDAELKTIAEWLAAGAHE